MTKKYLAASDGMFYSSLSSEDRYAKILRGMVKEIQKLFILSLRKVLKNALKKMAQIGPA